MASPIEQKLVDPKRHPAALAGAISSAWRPYRWRAYTVAVLAGLLAGGIVAPVVTTSLLLVLALARAETLEGVPWSEGVWVLTFALTVPLVGATVFARWQPQRLRDAAQTYIWLAARAEDHWASVFGTQPVPRDERSMRAALASTPETAETAGARFGLWMGLLELDRARAAAAEMPVATPRDRLQHAGGAWLLDFVAGTTRSLESLQLLLGEIEDPDEQVEAVVALAVNRARVALSEGQDWQAPLAATTDLLGTAPERPYNRIVWRPTFRTLLISAGIGLIVFWIAMLGLGPYFPMVPR